MKSGIYKIVNINTEMIYIGSSQDVPKRQYAHQYHLLKGTHHCVYLQRSWNKYGKDAFVFGVIENNVNIADLIVKEQYYIDLAKKVGLQVYNTAPIAGVTRGCKRTPEQIEKTVKHHRGKKYSEERRKIISETSKGRKHTEESKRKISMSRLGPLNPQWGKPLTDKQMQFKKRTGKDHPNYGLKFSPEICEKFSLIRAKPIFQYSINGVFIKEWRSARNASKELKLDISGIRNAANGRLKTSGGFCWKRQKN